MALRMKISIQEFADSIVAPEYRQPVKTIDDCLDAHGWERVDFPECCGTPVEIRSFIGSAYFAQCDRCKKFIVDVTGPTFGNSWVNLPDHEKIDMDDDSKRWICGVETPTPRQEETP
jgi:hypothetical protein